MPLLEKYRHGTPCWVDLATSDLDAAKEFHAGLFGWTYIDEQMGEMGIGTYSMAMVNDVATAAIYELAPGQIRPETEQEWHVYVTVDDIDSVLDNVRKRGDKALTEATDVDRAGWVAVIEDPTGCQTTIWQPGEFQGSLIRAEPGALTWTEHVTTDLEQSVSFYKDALGIATATAPQGKLNDYAMWIVDDSPVAGMFQWPDEMIADGVPSMWFAYFQVADLDAAVDYVKASGGKPMADAPAVNAIGRFIVLRDPQGADFCAIEPHWAKG